MKRHEVEAEGHRRWGDGAVVREKVGREGRLKLRWCEVGYIEPGHPQPWRAPMIVVASAGTWAQAFRAADVAIQANAASRWKMLRRMGLEARGKSP